MSTLTWRRNFGSTVRTRKGASKRSPPNTACFVLPQFPDLRPARYRPDAGELQAAAIAWIRTSIRDVFDGDAALEHFIEQRTSLFQILCYPSATRNRLLRICNTIDLLFALDTAAARIGQDGGIDEALEQGLVLDRPPTASSSPWVRALSAMLDHLRAEMPTALWQRYAGQMARFLESVIAERRLLAEGKVADPEDYDRIRHHTIGGGALELAEYGIGVDLTKEIEICPEVTEIGAAVIRNWIAINDVFSYRKEVEQNDTTNKITLLRQDPSVGLQEAVDRVANAARNEVRIFREKREVILAGRLGERLPVRRYIEALWWMMTGNLEWSYITPRYHGRGHVWNGSTSGTVILEPTRTIFC